MSADSTTLLRRRRRLAVLAPNAALFLVAWTVLFGCEHFRWLRRYDEILAAVAAGISISQFLVLAFFLALHARPVPRRWLLAVAVIAGASFAYCTISLLFQLHSLIRRWIDPTFALFNQVALLLSLVAVGMLFLLLLRLAMWPCRHFLGWRVAWEEQEAGGTRQFSLAEIFFITAGVAVSCALARALFDALLTVPLVYGAILLSAALPTLLATFVVAPGSGRWRAGSVLLVWSCFVAILLTPALAWVHNELGLLDRWLGRWTTLQPGSPHALAIAAAFTLAVMFTGRLNWLLLARLGLRYRAGFHQALVPASATGTVDSAARLTPPAVPR
ncbi:MAG TPA: hypothetical protein VMP01_08725 [Pirellulaceae bacterium]|nr:hypothetical protein [Pirellulaceae bacterium]